MELNIRVYPANQILNQLRSLPPEVSINHFIRKHSGFINGYDENTFSMTSGNPSKHSFLYQNSLSIVLFLFFISTLWLQSLAGWKQYNVEMRENDGLEIQYTDYLTTSHFAEATFENWESEFFQMGMYVWFTIFLRQKGSSESKSMDEKEEVDREPQPHPNAPWPVKKGGIWLKLYQNSLTITFLLLFLFSFIFHASSSLSLYNEEQIVKGKPTETMSEFITNSQLWFESFQNWQSEFLAVFSIVILSIFLRQKGSPESKPVDAPCSETGK